MEREGAQKGEVRAALLTYWCAGQEQSVSVGSERWYSWLEDAMSFRFTGEEGTFTAHRARSGSGRGGWYWRAYQRRQGRLKRCYLGKSEDLSLARLQAVARQLSAEVRPAEIAFSSEDTASLEELEEEALVLTKLFVPRLSMQHISRPRLLALLDRAVEASALILVSAPAGSGKTTLLAEWSTLLAKGRRIVVRTEAMPGASPAPVRPIQVAWLALESADDDIARWLTYLIAALARLDPRIGQRARTLLRATQSGNVERVLTSLVNDLATCLAHDAILILDDYHLITLPEIHKALLFLLDHLPEHLRLVLGTRADPPFSLARLRARGQLSEVRGEDLRFAPAEVAAFLREMGLELNADDLRSLEQRAEGWIAGIQLLALALRGRANPAALLDALAGSHRFLLDYLSDEVLQRQSVELRDFLLRTSVLERLCGPLCDALTGRSDGQATLTELRRSNIFTSALDDAEQWYRYHPLFAAALRDLLQRQEPDLVTELCRRAGAWYEQQDLPSEAIEYALRAGDFPHAAALMEPLARAQVRRGDLTVLQSRVEALPEAILFARPHLCLAAAWFFLFGGQEERMRQLMAQVERYLAEHQEQRLTPEWRELSGEFLIFDAVSSLPENNHVRAIERSRAALEILPSEAHYQRNLASLCIAIAMSALHRTSGDMAAAEKALAHVSVERMEGYHLLSMIAIHDLAELYQVQGHLHKMARHYKQLLASLATIAELPILLTFFIYADYVGLMYEWNRLDEAEVYLERIFQAYQQGAQDDGMVSLILLPQANIAVARGRATEALQLLHELDEMLGSGLIPPLFLEEAGAQQARILLHVGQLEGALRWARTCQVRLDDQIDEHTHPESFFLYMTLARVLIAQAYSEQDTRNLAAVMQLLESWRRLCAQRNFNGLLIDVLVLKALALAACGATPQALETLEQALILAEPEGYIRTFADKGEPMARLLASLAARPEKSSVVTRTYIQSLLAAIRGDGAFQLAGVPPVPRQASFTALLEPLTAREQEVLNLLATGASNQAIADTLIITPNTAKRHVKHILGKLGAANRVQAVVRARELKLL